MPYSTSAPEKRDTLSAGYRRDQVSDALFLNFATRCYANG
jgi:hypothetical protein